MHENTEPTNSRLPTDIRSAIARSDGLKKAMQRANRGPSPLQEAGENIMPSGHEDTSIVTPTFRPDQTLVEISSPPIKMDNDEKSGISLQEIIRRATGREQTPPEGNKGR